MGRKCRQKEEVNVDDHAYPFETEQHRSYPDMTEPYMDFLSISGRFVLFGQNLQVLAHRHHHPHPALVGLLAAAPSIPNHQFPSVVSKILLDAGGRSICFRRCIIFSQTKRNKLQNSLCFGL